MKRLISTVFLIVVHYLSIAQVVSVYRGQPILRYHTDTFTCLSDSLVVQQRIKSLQSDSIALELNLVNSLLVDYDFKIKELEKDSSNLNQLLAIYIDESESKDKEIKGLKQEIPKIKRNRKLALIGWGVTLISLLLGK